MILIIGATGINGTPALKALLDSGQQVRAMVRSSQSAAKLPQAKNLEVVMGDVNDPQSLTQAFKGVHK